MRGRSPLRIAILALAISRRSIVAIRRPNRVLEAVRRNEVVSDIFVPLKVGQRRAAFWGANYVYQIPETTALFA